MDLDPPKHRKDNLRETLERKDYSKTNYLPFEEARAYVHKQELTIVRPSILLRNRRSAFPRRQNSLLALITHHDMACNTSADMDASH